MIIHIIGLGYEGISFGKIAYSYSVPSVDCLSRHKYVIRKLKRITEKKTIWSQEDQLIFIEVMFFYPKFLWNDYSENEVWEDISYLN